MKDTIEQVMDLQPSCTHISTERMKRRGTYIRRVMCDWLRERDSALGSAVGLRANDLLVSPLRRSRSYALTALRPA